MRYISILFFLFLFSSIQAQDENLKFDDCIYKDVIRSVKFHKTTDVLSYPITRLDGGDIFVLTFDDLRNEIRDITYTIQHCNADWQPSGLEDIEYIKGFTDEKITEYDFSTSTLTPFIHYRLNIPNEDMSWTKSGNYILKVYDEEDKKELLITRRFMVVENSKIVLDSKISYPSNVSKSNTHHEIDFTIHHKDVKIRNPQREIKIAILQNGRWDNAITGLKPLFIKTDQLIYDYQDKIVFLASKEFRPLDLRTFRYRTAQMERIEEFDDGYLVNLYTDKMREFMVYLLYHDINGKFVIENIDAKSSISNNPWEIASNPNKSATNQNIENDNQQSNTTTSSRLNQLLKQNNDQYNFEDDIHNLRGDYAFVQVSLARSLDIENSDVYIFGGLSDWKCKDEFKMEYNEQSRQYEIELFLKQGFYNYIYAVKNRKTNLIDFVDLEGSWFETENDYHIFIYHRPFGARFDHLIGVQKINSLRQ